MEISEKTKKRISWLNLVVDFWLFFFNISLQLAASSKGKPLTKKWWQVKCRCPDDLSGDKVDFQGQTRSSLGFSEGKILLNLAYSDVLI